MVFIYLFIFEMTGTQGCRIWGVTEIVTMKLGPRRKIGWVEDLPEGGTRHLVGWDPKMEGDFEEIWRSGNSWWRLEPGSGGPL